MRDGDTEPSEERVRRALGRLGADPDSAPEVPPAITARIGAALRAAPPAHAASTGRFGWVALVICIAAILATAAVALAVVLHSGQAPRFPTGPTAETMTVPPTPANTPEPVVTEP